MSLPTPTGNPEPYPKGHPLYNLPANREWLRKLDEIKGVGTTIKTVGTNAVTGLWWSASKDPSECDHIVSRLYTRICAPNAPEFYQEFCGECGFVHLQYGERP